MKAVIYYPTEYEAVKELERLVALVHANAVNNYISKLPISAEEKEQLNNLIIKEAEKLNK